MGKPWLDGEGTVHIPAFEVPLSSYMSPGAKATFIEEANGDTARLTTEDLSVQEVRRLVDRHHLPLIDRARQMYSVNVERKSIAGVTVDDIMPAGADSKSAHRVLINLHGGAFVTGSGAGGQLESIPIASIGNTRVVSVDYRLAPENGFPAATEDVVAVYRELLGSYHGSSIGIYGCSSGGLLAAEVVAALHVQKLSAPGAVGIFCTGLDPIGGGDSSYLSTQLNVPFILPPPEEMRPRLTPPSPYFKIEDCSNPLAFPLLSPAILEKFPSSLVITGTRDRFMSPAVFAHTQLVKNGVAATLHVWEGMWHGFLYRPDMPEAVEAYRVIAGFFAKHLGRDSCD